MKLRLFIIIAAILAFLLLNSGANAGYLDPDQGWKNITTYDGFSGPYEGKKNKWWNKNEDKEVEPGSATGQKWDLEGFFLNDGTGSVETDSLALVGGFDFAEGEGWVDSGDIFIDTDMDNSYWEYVMDLDFDPNNPENNSKYTVYENDGSMTFNTTHGGPSGGTQGQAWTYASGGTVVTGFENIALNYLSNLSNKNMGGGLKGGSHNAVIVDVSFLGSNKTFSAWNAIECGNDITTGGGTTSAVPEPATIFLLGSGLLGLFGYRKKFRKSKN